jgi:Ca2+-binding RTX toxin-like protein
MCSLTGFLFARTGRTTKTLAPKSQHRPQFRVLVAEFLEPRLAPASAVCVDAQVDLILRLVNPDGSQLSSLAAGQDFMLQVATRDVRTQPRGVFAAYFDITWDPAKASLTGPIQHSGTYSNGRTGDASVAGLIDEAGGFAGGSELGGGMYEVLRVPMRAAAGGDLTLAADAAEVHPDHNFLVYGSNDEVPPANVCYGSVSIDIARLAARDDAFAVTQQDGPVILDVVANDFLDPAIASLVTISSASQPDHGGVIAVRPDGRGLDYTPVPGFLGSEVFSYTIDNGQGDSSSATVSVTVVPPGPPQVDVIVELTNPNGSPLTRLAPAQDFVLHVMVKDLRSMARGVFAAYVDVSWDAGKAVATGPITFGSAYSNGHDGGSLLTGLADDLGGFAGFSELGGGAFEVFSVPMRATGAGSLVFTADPADALPEHFVLLYGSNIAVAPVEIRYGAAAITVANPLSSPGALLDQGVLYIQGSGGRDTLNLSVTNNRLQVSGNFGPTLIKRTFTPAAVQRIMANLAQGDDRLTIGSSVRAQVVVDAGGGNDNLRAGGGSAVLIGGDGNDILNGNTRRDVLIGGRGRDQLFGALGNDLLISGTTSHDQNPAVLRAIQQDWNSTRSMTVRVANLRQGAGPLLAPFRAALTQNVTVFHDGAADALFGGGDPDWFFIERNKDRHDRGRSEPLS